MLLHFPYAVRVWELAPFIHKPSLNIDSIAQLLQYCRRIVNLPPTGLGATPLFPWVLWVLWTNRNKLLFEDLCFSEENAILKAIQDARAWKAAQTHVKMPSLPRSVVPLFTVPAANTYTWSSFSYAAWDSSTRNCGMGWQLRDSMDVCADQGSSHRCFVPSALVAEALAVKAAMTAALSSHVCSLVVYSDSKSLIKLLNTQGLDVA